MNEVLIISAEPRLADAIKDAVGSAENHFTVVDRWATGQALLFKDHFDVVCLDYECLKLEALDAFITIDNVFQKEQTVGVLLVRQLSQRARDLESSLQSIKSTIDMSQGKPQFVEKLTRVFSSLAEIRARLDERSVEIDNIITLEKDLPNVENGSLSSVPLSRLFYALRVRKESGVLTVTAGGRSGKVAFRQGELAEGPGYGSRSDALSMFEWVGGSYTFERKEVSGNAVDTFSLILAGVSRVPYQSLLDALQTQVELYPVPTNLWEDRQEKTKDFVALSAFMRVCDGATSLNDVVTGLGSMSHEGFKAAYYAVQTDLVHLHDSKNASGAIITYDRDIRRQREKVDAEKVKQTKAFRATADRSELEKELNAQLQFMKRASPHDVFGVWEGCGRKVVQERFYALVKETHPDVYGGNVSGEVKTLSQEIFMLVKATYQGLLKVERQQTVAPPADYDVPDDGEGLGEPSEVNFKDGERPRTGTSNRPLRVTPTPKRTPQATPVQKVERRPTPRPASAATPSEERRKTDVASKIAQLSGFQKRKSRVARRRSKTDPGQNAAKAPEFDESNLEEFSDLSEAHESENSLGEESTPAELDERKQRLEALMKRTSEKTGAGAPDPAKDAFNEGFQLFRAEDNAKAYEYFQKAYELDKEDARYLTFYGYMMYLNEPHRIDEAEDIIRKALNTKKNAKAARPDTHLFWGHILKARGLTEKALKQYEAALRLNPLSKEAEREIRLGKMRAKRRTSEPGTFIKNLFKK